MSRYKYNPLTSSKISRIDELLTSTITTPQVTTNQNDYSPSGLAPKVFLRVDLDNNREFTGFDASGFTDRDYFYFANISDKNAKIKKDNIGSIITNRVILDADYTIMPEAIALFVYDGTSQRWRIQH